MRIYLDNCCYNRPYDDQNQSRIMLETQAKLLIQDLIKDKKIELASSFSQRFENRKNPYEGRQISIGDFLRNNTSFYIGAERLEDVRELANKFMSAGLKGKDAYHMSSAVLAKCDYFISTDDRILKYDGMLIKSINPIDFMMQWKEGKDE